MDKSLFSNLWNKAFRSGNPLFLFIGLNTLVFLLMNVLRVFIALRIMPDSTLPILLSVFQLPAFLPDFLIYPWTLITYMFTQMGFFHFLFNMLWLFWMGQIFLDFLSRKQLIFTYLAGGLVGGLLFLLAYNTIPVFVENRTLHGLIGASASVSAVVFATATLLPDYSIRMLFFGNVKLKYLALVFIILDLLGVGSGNAGGSIAHIGGAILGFVFIRQLQRGNDWSRILDKRTWKRKPKLRVASRKTALTSQEQIKSTKEPVPNQETIDQILDKISQSGYDSLSKTEKEALFKASSTKDKTEG